MRTPKVFAVITIAAAGLIASTMAALAVPAVATTAVNVRSGPGVNFAVVDTLFSGEAVDVTECQGGWCYVEHPGPDGWVSGNYLQAVDNGGGNGGGDGGSDDAAAAAALNIFNTILGAVISTAAPPPPPPPPPPPAQLNGVYTIVQKSSGRFLDAYEGMNDNNVVTRNQQFNATQAWIITPLGGNIYTIQQQSNGRYLDAHEGINDNSVVTRNAQNNNTQRWKLTYLGNFTYTIQQLSNGRYMDAHEGVNDNSVVTRNNQNNDTQRWIIQ